MLMTGPHRICIRKTSQNSAKLDLLPFKNDYKSTTPCMFITLYNNVSNLITLLAADPSGVLSGTDNLTLHNDS